MYETQNDIFFYAGSGDAARHDAHCSDGVGNVEFRGNYSPVVLTSGDASNLYLGSQDKLYWPSANKTIGSFQAYFRVNLGGEVQVRAIRMNLGDKVTGVESVQCSMFNVQTGTTCRAESLAANRPLLEYISTMVRKS